MKSVLASTLLALALMTSAFCQNDRFLADLSTEANGYVFYQGLDSNGGDITQLVGQTPDQLKAYCNSDPSCVAFNTNGWVKSSLIPQSQWYQWSNSATEGLYVKSQPVTSDCYVFYQGLDSYGGDITQLSGQTPDQLKAYCNSNPSCVAFNTNGWVKSSLIPRSQWPQWSDNANEGLYVKSQPMVINNGYVFYQGLDSNGGDITQLPGQTPDQLKAYCNSNPSCLAFNTNGWVKSSLIPRSQWPQWSDNANEGLYVKSQPITNTDGYVFYQGLDSNGGDITQLAGQSVAQIKAYCNSNPSCIGFNTNGWVKSSLIPRSQWPQWSDNANEGFYIKPRYLFYQDLDSNGGDITQMIGKTVAQLRAYCDSLSNCVGFNTNGWIKSSLIPTANFDKWSDSPADGLYVKTNVPATTW